MQEHLLKGNQTLRKFLQQLVLLLAPLTQATPPELPLFVAEKRKLLVARDEFLPVDIVQSKGHPFDLILDMPPKDVLEALPLARKQAELKSIVEVFGDNL